LTYTGIRLGSVSVPGPSPVVNGLKESRDKYDMAKSVEGLRNCAVAYRHDGSFRCPRSARED